MSGLVERRAEVCRRLLRSGRLSRRERKFVESVSGRAEGMSSRQLGWLRSIWVRIKQGEGLRGESGD